jgi:hypothetical protein
MTIWCYYRAVMAEPGKVPANWRPRTLAGLSDEEIEVKVEAYKKMAAKEKIKVALANMSHQWLAISLNLIVC